MTDTDTSTDPKSNTETVTDAPEQAATTDESKAGVSSKVWMGTAVGVGSAALVAALMYAKRRK